MTAKALKDLLARAESWPEDAQVELAAIALEIEAELAGDKYHASPEELAGIDRGLEAAREGRFASEAEVETVFAKHRRTSRSPTPTRRSGNFHLGPATHLAAWGCWRDRYYPEVIRESYPVCIRERAEDKGSKRSRLSKPFRIKNL